MTLARRDEQVALRIGSETISYAQLAASAGRVGELLGTVERVAVIAEPVIETVIAIIGALAAGIDVVPVNPKAGPRERDHILRDAAPARVLTASDIDRSASGEFADQAWGSLVVYTSGTTGPAKGVILPADAIITNVASIARRWRWTAADRVAHALPLFHVHGLVLGTLAPLMLGGASHHLGSFDPAAVAAAVSGGATMVFAVPTMWSRIATAAQHDPIIAGQLRQARLLVSGSAALPLGLHERLHAVIGLRVLERYGMTETLFSTAERAGTDAPAGSVGPPLDVVEFRLVDDHGQRFDTCDDETLGEVQVRGPSLFRGYLNRPDATAAAFTDDGYFRTGDIATRRADGSVRLVGRRATDLIKSGGYRIGAGEIEACLLEHPAVREAAVLGVPDDELGERIVAYVAVHQPVAAEELRDHVATLLTPHKRPRAVRFVDALPRNAMGKVLKSDLPR